MALQLRALFAYHGNASANQLSFPQGAIITVDDPPRMLNQAGWTFGSMAGLSGIAQKGWFPSSYAQVVEPPNVSASTSSLGNFSTASPNQGINFTPNMAASNNNTGRSSVAAPPVAQRHVSVNPPAAQRHISINPPSVASNANTLVDFAAPVMTLAAPPVAQRNVSVNAPTAQWNVSVNAPTAASATNPVVDFAAPAMTLDQTISSQSRNTNRNGGNRSGNFSMDKPLSTPSSTIRHTPTSAINNSTGNVPSVAALSNSIQQATHTRKFSIGANNNVPVAAAPPPLVKGDDGSWDEDESSFLFGGPPMGGDGEGSTAATSVSALSQESSIPTVSAINAAGSPRSSRKGVSDLVSRTGGTISKAGSALTSKLRQSKGKGNADARAVTMDYGIPVSTTNKQAGQQRPTGHHRPRGQHRSRGTTTEAPTTNATTTSPTITTKGSNKKKLARFVPRRLRPAKPVVENRSDSITAMNWVSGDVREAARTGALTATTLAPRKAT